MTREVTASHDRDLEANGSEAAIDVVPGTIVVFADIGCPWAHLAIFRLHTWRDRLGLKPAEARCIMRWVGILSPG
ncbi:MAG: hypothetical protein H0W55_05445 [Actinobacteria bacterium]|jgi:hypothetical protein|nr:hypothetical protein [Actinomycetota bacterium]